jgi:hypothetical protein
MLEYFQNYAHFGTIRVYLPNDNVTTARKRASALKPEGKNIPDGL